MSRLKIIKAGLNSASLHKFKPIRTALSLATCSLLGMSSAVRAADNGWEIDSALLLYSETDRVQVAEPVVSAVKELHDAEFLRLRFVIDSLTGPSPSGAIPTATAQTFTSPSGAAVYAIKPYVVPLDPTFHDTRAALNIEWEKPMNYTLKRLLSTNISREFDYTSMGVGAMYSKDIHQRNTTLAGGLSLGLDLVSPVGGIPVGMTSVPLTTATKKTRDAADDTKTLAELLLGFTQVIDRKTLMQFNYTLGSNTGYLTDPYKILSVVDASNVLLTSNDRYRFEKRPDARVSHALYWKAVHQFGSDVSNASYRFFWDDCGINSHTLDLRYRLEFAAKNFLQPRLRYYRQSKADFYHYKLVDSAMPTLASADYRLADMSSITFGLLYGLDLGAGHDFTLRAERIKQSAQGSDPFPDVQAILIQVSYSFRF